jgi:hypothetical protein
LAPTLPEERVKISWVTIDRICQEQADGKENVRRELGHTGKPLRSSAEPLSDDELLAKLRDSGLNVDRDGVERLCGGALSAEEVAGPIVDKLGLGDDMTADWVWISLLALWQRWWPDRPCLELLDDKMQAGYARDAENDTHAAAGIPRAELLPLEGVGHQLPPRPWWTSVIAAMLRHTSG